MRDLERIELIIQDIEVYRKKLIEFNIKTKKDLEDDKNYYSSSMIVFNIINRLIDLAEEIVRQKNLIVAFKYKDFFDSLLQSKLISKKTSEGCKELITLRNKISHRYGKVTKEEILESIKKVDIIEDFIEEVKKNL
jgi:uncharacterized protein YutE (UPF0331/DUF86 family)